MHAQASCLSCMLTNHVLTPYAVDEMISEFASSKELVNIAACTSEEVTSEAQTEQIIEVMRNRTSSYEDIYTAVELEQYDNVTEGDKIEIGDRFDTRHPDTHLMRRADGRSSSFEDLYGSTLKEVEEEKNGEKPEETSDDASTASEPMAKALRSEVQNQTPIDVTYPSGLNLIGQDECAEKSYTEHERLSRTGSLDIHSSAPKRRFHRQISSPDGLGFPDFQEEESEIEGILR